MKYIPVVLLILSFIPMRAEPPVSAEALALVPTDQQITDVAALLPAKPVGVGRPITDRAAWATAIQQPYFQKQLKDADLYATQPIPDLGELPTNNYWINRDPRPTSSRSERAAFFCRIPFSHRFRLIFAHNA